LNKLNTSALILLSVFVFIPTTAHATPSDWYNNDWQFAKVLTFNSSVINGSHVDFPALINITDSELAASAASDGLDILFTNINNNTKLDHEVEQFDSSNGWLTAWVKIPILSTNNDNKIVMYYNDTGSNGQQNNTNAVWENYHLVLHMGERLEDVSGNNIDCVNVGTSQQTGMINGYRLFDGINDYISCDDSYLDLVIERDVERSHSLWFYPDSTIAGTDNIISKGTFGSTYPDDQRFNIEWRTPQADTRVCLRQTPSMTYVCYWTDSVGSVSGFDKWYMHADGWQDYDNSGAMFRNEWSSFRNGTCVLEHTATTNGLNPCGMTDQDWTNAFTNNTNPFTIGCGHTGASCFDGRMDELRISKINYYEDWYNTEYNMKLSSDKDQWITVGNQGTNPSPDYDTINIKLADRFQNHIAVVTNTDITTDLDIGLDIPVEIPITGNIEFLDSSFGIQDNGVLCLFDGRVKVTASIHVTNSGAQRSNQFFQVALNGEQLPQIGASGYIRGYPTTAHGESSLHVSTVFECEVGDLITLTAEQEGVNSDTHMSRVGSSIMIVERIQTSRCSVKHGRIPTRSTKTQGYQGKTKGFRFGIIGFRQ
jgi:hypothetical protein